jgi:hypothetical protein
MRRAAQLSFLILPLLTLQFASCGGRQTVTTSATPTARPGEMDPAVLRRAVDVFGERLVSRTTNLADDIDRSIDDPHLRRKTLQWRLRSAGVAFSAQHNPNTLVALIELWYWTAAVASYFDTPGVALELGDQAAPAHTAAVAMRDEADNLAARALPPAVHQRLRDDLTIAVGKGEVFAADSAQSQAALDQFLSVTRIEKLLAIPLAPFEVFGSVNQGSNAVTQMAITADRAVDLAEKYPQILQWRLNLVALDIQDLGLVKRLEGQLTQLTTATTRLPEELRTQAVKLLDDSQPAQATAQKTLQEVATASSSITALMAETRGGLADLDRFLDKIAQPEPQPPTPAAPAEPFRIADYIAAAETATALVKELRGALTDLEKPALAERAQAATAEMRSTAEATIDHATLRTLQVLGTAFLGGLALILVARWRR